MKRRIYTTVALLAVSMVAANLAHAVEVTTFRGETGSALDLHSSQSQSSANTNPPVIIPNESGTPWVDYGWGGVAEGPPDGAESQHKLSLFKPDLSQVSVPAGQYVESVELDIHSYSGGAGTWGLALVTEANNLAEWSIACPTTGNGDPSGCTDNWADFGKGWPFNTVERDGAGEPVLYGLSAFSEVGANSGNPNVVTGADLATLVDGIISGVTDYHGFLLLPTGNNNINWCENSGGWCGENGESLPEMRVTVAPEPASLALLGIGGTLMMLRRRMA